MPFRILFFGTPAFAVPSLEAVAASPHRIVGVVTQPDRARGRGHKVVPEAVKAAATARGLQVIQPERLKDPALLKTLEDLAPDLGVVAAYGRILPAEMLSLPRLGLINVHASLLPRWRGAAPVHRAILAGDQITGVTIMRVVQALDAGPMLDRAEVAIPPDETSAELEMRLAALGAERLRATIDRLDASARHAPSLHTSGEASPDVIEVPQDETLVTYASRLERRDSIVDWARPAQAVHNQIRGLQPWPLAAAVLHNRRVLLRRSQVADAAADAGAPGAIVEIEKDSLLLAAQPGVIRLLELQLEGRAPVGVRAFLAGHQVSVGDRFETLPAASP